MANHLNENETRPAINTAGLRKSLDELKGKLPSLIPNYNRDADLGGFFGVIITLLGWIAEAFSQFENTACAPLVEAGRKFRQAKREFDPEGLLTRFKTGLTDAYTLFRNAVRKACVERVGRDRDRLAQLVQYSEQKPQIARELWLHEFRMTGEGMVVEPVDYQAHDRNFWKWFTLITIGEIALGFYLFELSSSSVFALALSVTTSMGIMFSRHKATGSKVLMNAVKDAEAAYRKNYPNGRDNFEGREIQLYPISQTVVDTYRKATLTYWLTAVGLLGWRIWVSWNDPAAGITGVFGSVAMIILSMVYSWVNDYPKFQRELQEQWQSMRDDLNTADSMIAELSVPDPNDPFDAKIADVKSTYYNSTSSVREEVDSDLDQRRNSAQTLTMLFDQYNGAYRMAELRYQALWPQACNAVVKLNHAANTRQFEDQEVARRVDQMFSRFVRPSLEDAELIKQAQEFNPQVELAETALDETTLDRTVAEIRREVTNEEAAQAAYQPIVVNREVN